VVNADHVFDFPVGELGARAGEAGFCMAVRPRPRGEGRVGLGGDGRVVRLRGECFGEEVLGADYLSVSALGPAALEALPEQGCLVGDFALPRLRRGDRIESVAVSGEVLSIGDSLADYLQANQRWLAGRPCHVGDGARVAPGVRLQGSVIGAGAEVSGDGSLAGCVVWPGARARAPLAGAVVTGRHKVAA
jgi:mannose-1-phosphate guanylyltransferase